MLQGRGILIFSTIFFFVTGIALLRFADSLIVEKPVSQNQQLSSDTEQKTNQEIDSSNTKELGLSGDRVVVAKVIDGDTFETSTGEKVRLLGVDTPETVDPRRPVGCFGKEASNELKSLIQGEEVIMQKDVSDVDKYQRLLRYVYLPLADGKLLFVNDYLVREGFAQILTYPPDVAFANQFQAAQEQAKMARRGLWGNCKNG